MDPEAPASKDSRDCTSTQNPAVIVFSANVVQRLDRLEPTYVGVRRVRPSSRVVQNALFSGGAKQQQLINSSENSPANEPNVDAACDPLSYSEPQQRAIQAGYVFKTIGEDGVERRMTNKEKKAMKNQRLEVKRLAKLEQRQLREEQEALERIERKRQKKRKRQNNKNDNVSGDNPGEKSVIGEMAQEGFALNALPTDETTSGDFSEENTAEKEDDMQALNQVGISLPSISPVEQELADLRGERHGVPPVMIPPALAHAALVNGHILPGGDSHSSLPRSTQTKQKGKTAIRIDDDLAREWAEALVGSMRPAWAVREQEDMRPMAYEIVPDVWTRLRPKALGVEKCGDAHKPLHSAETKGLENEETEQKICRPGKSWAFVQIRPPSKSSFDSDLALVAEVLHEHTNIHISCGAKFGCDYLLYDGPRKERHAFAGLRLMTESDDSSSNGVSGAFPLPSAYCVAGFVRCLNTAGKLALLATARRDIREDGSTVCRIAFLDLKLERVDGTKRKDMTEVLQKLNRSVTD